MTIVRHMIEYRRLAAHARCRVTKWRITRVEAWALAHELADVFQLTPIEVFERIIEGTARVMGAQVALR